MSKSKTSPDDDAARIAELREKIRYYDRKYFVENTEEISDHQYDLLVKELEELENRHPDLVTADSPTQSVSGEPRPKLKRVKHRVRMLSIAKALSAQELLPFDKRIRQALAKEGIKEKVEYIVEPKVDGVSLSLRYEKGILTLAATRGFRGEEGDDVTENAKTVAGIPSQLNVKSPPDLLEVRGEVYMSFTSFETCNQKLREEGTAPFANPRNATSGSLKLLDSRVTARRGLLFFAYAIGETKGISFKTQQDVLETLATFGLPVNSHMKLCGSIDQVVDLTKEWEKLRTKLDYPWDGMVIKVNSLKQQEVLGFTGKAPVGMIAFKFEPEEVTTKLLDVDWQVGRTGVLTPVARLQPVQLAGTTVANATLHNIDEIRKKSLRLSDDVVIEKAGEIIPQVVKVAVHHKGREIIPPQACPVCCEPLAVEESKEAEYDKLQYQCTNKACPRAEGWKTIPRRKGVATKRKQCQLCKSPVEIRSQHIAETVNTTLRCVFPLCPAMLRERIVFFASRSAMDIKGLGPAFADILVENNFVKGLADIFTLESKRSGLVAIERKGETSVGNLLEAIQKSKSRGLARLMTGLGIPNVGREIAEALAKTFRTMQAIQGGGAEVIDKVDLLEFFSDKRAEKLIEELHKRKVGVINLSKWCPGGLPPEKGQRRSFLIRKLTNLPAVIEKRINDEKIVDKTKADIEAFRDTLGIREKPKFVYQDAFSDPENFFAMGEVQQLLSLLGFFLAPHSCRLTRPVVRELAVHFAARRRRSSEDYEIPLEEFRRYISRVAYFLPTASLAGPARNEQFAHTEDVGLIVAQNIVEFFDTPEAIELVDKLRKCGVTMDLEADGTDAGILAGKAFVVTGTLRNYSREQAEDKIRSLGGRAAGDVGKNVDYLIVGESPGGTKLEKAAKLNVPQLTEDEFEKMIAGGKGNGLKSMAHRQESYPGHKTLFDREK